ncbi:MAG: LacI family transcriptional regulator [Planctomycetia bacterium]|nr:LacI family transcriptional regulator [Planctomycetia bacterium]
MAKQRPTIRDVALAAGVSGPVVSTVLNNRTESTVRVSPQTRERVERVARELNYTPSILGRSLAQQKSYIVGLLLSAVNSPLAAEVIRGVQDIASPQRYSPMVFIHGNPEEEAAEFERSLDRRVDALIVDTFDTPADAGNVEAYRNLASTGFPLVELFGMSIPDVLRVNVDFEADARRATQHLLELGHRRIGLVVHEHYHKKETHWAGWGFYSGYRAVLEKAGLEPIVIPAPAVTAPGDGLAFIESGRYAGRELLALAERPTAVISYSNRRAYGVVQAFLSEGLKVPEDVSVLGYYERDVAVLTDPPLSSLCVAAREAGQAAAKIAFGIMQRKPVETVAVASEWMPRGSTSALSASQRNTIRP